MRINYSIQFLFGICKNSIYRGPLTSKVTVPINLKSKPVEIKSLVLLVISPIPWLLRYIALKNQAEYGGAWFRLECMNLGSKFFTRLTFIVNQTFKRKPQPKTSCYGQKYTFQSRLSRKSDRITQMYSLPSFLFVLPFILVFSHWFIKKNAIKEIQPPGKMKNEVTMP